jgi:superfamily I DNA/RNA helicase
LDYLLEKDIAPSKILALTFTTKPPEMKERIEILLGGDRAKLSRMGTFHSMFARIPEERS